MKHFFILFSLFIFINTLSAQIQKDTTQLTEVNVQGSTTLKLKQENGLYVVSVLGTNFKTAINTWDGLKKVPMLRVNDGKDIRVSGKIAVVEINGILIQMNGLSLENYIKAIDSKMVKKIEINTNPSASYGTEVEAVINIILIQKNDSYRIGITTTNAINTRYYNNTVANYAVDFKKVHLYLSYKFDYLPSTPTSQIEQQIYNQPVLSVAYKEKNIDRNHLPMLNLNFELSKKDKLDLTQSYSYNNEDKIGNSNNQNFERIIQSKYQTKALQLAQIWQHRASDKVSFKLGAYEVLKNSTNYNTALTNNITAEIQNIKTNIPIYIAFFDYKNRNKLGQTTTGLKYNNIKVTNKNSTLNNQQNTLAPFNYTEQVAAAYIKHSLLISETKNINFGLRSESSFIKYDFSNSVSNQFYSNTQNYTNLLYSLGYDWATKNERSNSLTFIKKIKRPNYAYLNPFESINSDLIYFAGESNIRPSKTYSLSFETNKNTWTMFAQTGLIKDFISSFYESKNNNIVSTYKNFETLTYQTVGVEYNNSFFKEKWETKISFDCSLFQPSDSKYVFQKNTPNINFNTNNTITLPRNYSLNLNYVLTPTYKDGLIKHHLSHQFDISILKSINNKFSFSVFANDLFKTAYIYNETTIANYFYTSKLYPNTRALGLNLIYNLTGKTYKKRNLEPQNDNSIQRLEK